MPKNTPLILMILDGWGYSEHQAHNAIAKAQTPQWDEWWHTCPHLLLDASGHSVGLPGSQMGNSEVGHMHIGAGRIVQQDLTRINDTIANGTFNHNPVLNQIIDTVQQTHKTLHIMGLLSPGGVHSHEDHLFALLALCDSKQYRSVCLHLFLDGRDTPPVSALHSINRLNQALKQHPVGRIASLCGRYYAMDRDKRWERVAPVYQMLVDAQSTMHFEDAQTAIESFYQQQITDEFIPPTLIGTPCLIEDGDALFFFNFRADRARQLSTACSTTDFASFIRTRVPQLSYFATMTEYDKQLPASVAYPTMPLGRTLGEVIAQEGLKQLRIAETEKYAHVTFFLNGGCEQVFDGEQRILIPSPKVATYDLKPEMSAPELTDRLIEAIQQHAFDVIICNYANADMVGHSGNMEATIQAIECLDACMHRVGEAIKHYGGTLVITADHGNAESMFDEGIHQAHTAHTSEPVPFLVVCTEHWHVTQKSGSLIDVAPTILALLGITPPKDMTGHILMEPHNEA